MTCVDWSLFSFIKARCWACGKNFPTTDYLKYYQRIHEGKKSLKSQELFHNMWQFMKGITLERCHLSAQSVARAAQNQNIQTTFTGSMKERNHWSIRSISTSGDDLWKESHWREAIWVHEVWEELLRIKIIKVPSEDPWGKETIEVSEAFQHQVTIHERNHTGEKPFKCISVARASHNQETWGTIRGSMKETTIEMHQMWQELFHIRWRFTKVITLRLAIQFIKVWQKLLRIMHW